MNAAGLSHWTQIAMLQHVELVARVVRQHLDRAVVAEAGERIVLARVIRFKRLAAARREQRRQLPVAQQTVGP